MAQRFQARLPLTASLGFTPIWRQSPVQAMAKKGIFFARNHLSWGYHANHHGARIWICRVQLLVFYILYFESLGCGTVSFAHHVRSALF